MENQPFEPKKEYEIILPITGEKAKIIEGDNFCMIIPLECSKDENGNFYRPKPEYAYKEGEKTTFNIYKPEDEKK